MPDNIRTKLLINNSWTFQYGNIEEAVSSDYDDSDWYHVGLPHSFGIPYFMENHFYVGYGCYRKTLIIPDSWLQKKLYLEFQGAFQETEVYINGRLCGTHKGGYTAFVFDITDYVKEGVNQLFVRVNNLWNPRLAPRAGEHVFNGGIYRDVSLLVTDPLHISWYGTFVRTTEVSAESAKVVISTELENHSGAEEEFTLYSTVEQDGETIFVTSSRRKLKPGSKLTLTQSSVVKNPKLWHPASPNLYILKSRVYLGERLRDEYETAFGIRWFTFTAENGFFLNGEPFQILGTNVHQDHAGWGDAVTHSGIRRDIKLIKDCGMNFIRGSHYPHHTFFAEECDRQGILFWSELCFWGIGGFKEDGYWDSSAYPPNIEDRQEFEESCKTALMEMIRTNRNHPSIFVWSMGNEVFFSRQEVLTQAQILVKRLVSLSHELDPTRPAASGGAQRGGFDLLGDLAGYNGDGASLYINPGFPNFVSEYGSYISDRPGEYAPHFTDGVETDYPWRSGKAIWCGFHHGSIADRMGHMGMIDYYRLPLLSWYWYRSNLLGIAPPKELSEGIPYGLVLSSDTLFLKTDGTEDAHICVAIVNKEGERIKNSLPVTLQVEAGGALFPTGRSITLSPEKGSLLEGLGAIELRAFYAGDITVSASAEGLAGASLSLKATDSATEDAVIAKVIAADSRQWSEQKLSFQQSPPDVLIPGAGTEKIDIARNRPVFCSGFEEDYSSFFINDGNPATGWYPAKTAPGQWILQDLEGSKTVMVLTIRFRRAKDTLVEIYASEDNSEFELLAKEVLKESGQTVTLLLSEKKLRYIRIFFPGTPAEVSSLEVYQ